jgi:hypothetical protein
MKAAQSQLFPLSQARTKPPCVCVTIFKQRGYEYLLARAAIRAARMTFFPNALRAFEAANSAPYQLAPAYMRHRQRNLYTGIL